LRCVRPISAAFYRTWSVTNTAPAAARDISHKPVRNCATVDITGDLGRRSLGAKAPPGDPPAMTPPPATTPQQRREYDHRLRERAAPRRRSRSEPPLARSTLDRLQLEESQPARHRDPRSVPSRTSSRDPHRHREIGTSSADLGLDGAPSARPPAGLRVPRPASCARSPAPRAHSPLSSCFACLACLHRGNTVGVA